MIFVTIGTQAPFDRFIKIIDEIAKNLDEEIKELCKNYPQYRFMLYYKIMTTLQQIGNNDLLEKYYQEINTCIPMNEEQKDLLEVIKEIFG